MGDVGVDDQAVPVALLRCPEHAHERTRTRVRERAIADRDLQLVVVPRAVDRDAVRPSVVGHGEQVGRAIRVVDRITELLQLDVDAHTATAAARLARSKPKTFAALPPTIACRSSSDTWANWSLATSCDVGHVPSGWG